jgi:hypothetical protein
MIQLIRCAFTSLVVAAVWLAGTVYAQSAQRVIKVHIPFEFNIGDNTFPVGDYSVTQPLQDFLALRNARGQTIASTLTRPVESSTAPEKPALRFYFSGGHHALAEVWQPEDGALGGWRHQGLVPPVMASVSTACCFTTATRAFVAGS